MGSFFVLPLENPKLRPFKATFLPLYGATLKMQHNSLIYFGLVVVSPCEFTTYVGLHRPAMGFPTPLSFLVADMSRDNQNSSSLPIYQTTYL